MGILISEQTINKLLLSQKSQKGSRVINKGAPVFSNIQQKLFRQHARLTFSTLWVYGLLQLVMCYRPLKTETDLMGVGSCFLASHCTKSREFAVSRNLTGLQWQCVGLEVPLKNTDTNVQFNVCLFSCGLQAFTHRNKPGRHRGMMGKRQRQLQSLRCCIRRKLTFTAGHFTHRCGAF